MAEVQFGWLIRSIHSWAANLMIFTLFVHLFSVLLLKAYRPPREVTWFSGMALLGLAMGFGFTGYLLPWNELAFFATKVGTDITSAVPGVGDVHPALAARRRRGDRRHADALLRHSRGDPAGAATASSALHLYLVQRHGHERAARGRAKGEAARDDAVLATLPAARPVRLALGAGRARRARRALPGGAGREGRPVRARPGGHQARVVLHVHVPDAEVPAGHILGIEGEVAGILGFGLGGLFLLLVPILDRRTAQGRPGRLFTWIGIAIILYMVLFTILGYMASATK